MVLIRRLVYIFHIEKTLEFYLYGHIGLCAANKSYCILYTNILVQNLMNQLKLNLQTLHIHRNIEVTLIPALHMLQSNHML